MTTPIANQIERLNKAKADIKASIIAKGGFTGLKVNLNLSSCPLLTKESILNVFNKAANVKSSSKTLTLGSTNLSKLTDAEKAIATNKGWVLK